MQQNYIDYIQLKWTKKDLEWTKTIKEKLKRQKGGGQIWIISG